MVAVTRRAARVEEVRVRSECMPIVMGLLAAAGEGALARQVCEEFRGMYNEAVCSVTLKAADGRAPERGVGEAVRRLLAQLRFVTSVTAHGVFASSELLELPCERWKSVHALQLVAGEGVSRTPVPARFIVDRTPNLTQLSIKGGDFSLSAEQTRLLLAGLPRLVSLELRNVRAQHDAPAAVFASLAAATGLTRLTLEPSWADGHELDAPGLHCLGQLTGLHHLVLHEVCNVPGSDLGALSALRSLELMCCCIRGPCPALVGLETLRLERSCVDDEGGKFVSIMPSLMARDVTALTELIVEADDSVGNVVACLEPALGTACQRLQSLCIVADQTGEPDDSEAIVSLRAFTGLRRLRVHNFRDEGRAVSSSHLIRALPPMLHLTELFFTGMRVEPDDLHQALPHLRRLRSLGMEVSPAKRGALSSLSELTGLQSLILCDPRVRQRHAINTGWLEALTQLTSLQLYGGTWGGPMRSPSVRELRLQPEIQDSGKSIGTMVPILGRVRIAQLMPRIQIIMCPKKSFEWMAPATGDGKGGQAVQLTEVD